MAFACLPAKVVDGEILLLVTLNVDAPVRRVEVTPLRRDRDVLARDPARLDPGSKKLLCTPVPASSVEVPNPAGVRSVEHIVSPPLERRNVGLAGEIAPVPDVDVSRPPKRSEPEPERAGGIGKTVIRDAHAWILACTAGDVISLLRQLSVDLVLSGHRHVPCVWPAGRVPTRLAGRTSGPPSRPLCPRATRRVARERLDRVAIKFSGLKLDDRGDC